MKLKVLAVLLASLGTSSAIADLKPDVLDCDPKKAARNAAMGATVGISGPCDTGKAAKNAKEDVSDKAKDAVDIDRDGKKKLLKGDKDQPLLKHKSD